MLTDTTKRLLRPAIALVGWLMLVGGGASVMLIALTLKPKTRNP